MEKLFYLFFGLIGFSAGLIFLRTHKRIENARQVSLNSNQTPGLQVNMLKMVGWAFVIIGGLMVLGVSLSFFL